MGAGGNDLHDVQKRVHDLFVSYPRPSIRHIFQHWASLLEVKSTYGSKLYAFKHCEMHASIMDVIVLSAWMRAANLAPASSHPNRLLHLGCRHHSPHASGFGLW